MWLLLSTKVRLVFQSYIETTLNFFFFISSLLQFLLLNVQTLTLPPFWLHCHRHSNSKQYWNIRTSKCVGGGGFAYCNDCNTFPKESMVPVHEGYFKWRQTNYGGIQKLYVSTLSWSLWKLLCFQIFPLRKTLFLIRAIFIQGAFKNIQGLLGKIQGLFKDIPQISNFQGLFKDMMIFQGLFKARANHVNEQLSFYKLACRRNRHSIFLRKKIRATKLSQRRL